MDMAKLGEILVNQGIVSEEQVSASLARARRFGLKIGQALILENECSEENVADALAQKFGLERVNLAGHQIDASLMARMKKRNVERLRAIPLSMTNREGHETLAVAIAEPENLMILDELQVAAGCRVEPKVATESGISDLMRQIFGHDTSQATRDMSLVDIIFNQFIHSEFRTLLIQEDQVPTALGAPARVHAEGVTPSEDLVLLGEHETLDQFPPVDIDDMEKFLVENLIAEQMDHCRHVGGICITQHSGWLGKFTITVNNYREPGRTRTSRGSLPYTIQFDRVRISRPSTRSR
jgi:hypothetical protein